MADFSGLKTTVTVMSYMPRAAERVVNAAIGAFFYASGSR